MPSEPPHAGVASLLAIGELALLDEIGRDQEGPGERVERPDVGMEQVRPVRALATELGVEVEAAGGDAAVLEDLVERQREVLDRVRELVGVPAVLRIAAVGVDAAEDAVRDREGDLVMEAVTGERRVVRLDVDGVLTLEPVRDQEAVDRRDVVVVLVLGGLHRLGFDEELAPEPDPVLVLGDEMQELGELGALPSKVRVEEGVVPLPATPQDVVLAAEALGDLQHVLDLRGGEGEDLGIGIGGRARLVARVGEQVGGPPEQADAGPLLVAGGIVRQRVEVRTERREARAFRGDVPIVEAVVRDAELREELERDGHLRPRRRHLVALAVEPGPVHRARPEHVDTRPGERMPEAHARPQVVLHPRAEHEPIRLVHLERERIGRVEATEGDRPSHVRKEVIHHARSLLPQHTRSR